MQRRDDSKKAPHLAFATASHARVRLARCTGAAAPGRARRGNPVG
ncbi:hypothetical protein BURPS1106B_2702 [Burkholderia pseudomallei 1106b]|uniref:Uncharacterized protein n=1 Tax=Burkholderia pseudomallei 1710a TaxID=320371 RepID=A0A0E1VZC6_BURPE|nr:hypothetical protein BURPS1106B_2702 [Burkholderia pseudomallei 1106b]EET05381.1 hypothetical protein BURPS1710A_A1754 [Burkholderia pseudomallei 1710a]